MKNFCFAAALSLFASVGYGLDMECTSKCGSVAVEVRINDCEKTVSLRGTSARSDQYEVSESSIISEDGIGTVQFLEAASEYGHLVTLAADETTIVGELTLAGGESYTGLNCELR